MLRVEGKVVGTGVREGEEKTDYNTGRPYRTADRYVVALASGRVGDLPQFYNCDSKAVMDSIAANVQYDQVVELTARNGQYGRMLITGMVVAPVARTA